MILVEYIPTSAKDKSTIHQIVKKTLKGILFGVVPRAERGKSGDLMTADSEDLQESEASEIYVERFKIQDMFIKKEKMNFRVQNER